MSFDVLGAISSWAAEEYPPRRHAEEDPRVVAEKLREQLHALTSGVRGVVENVQGISTSNDGGDAAALVGYLRECIADLQDVISEREREMQQLRRTIALLQDERRKYVEQSSPLPPQPPPPPPQELPPEEERHEPPEEPRRPPTHRLADEGGADAEAFEGASPTTRKIAEASSAAAAVAADAARREQQQLAAAELAALEAQHGAQLASTLASERVAAHERLERELTRRALAARAELAAVCACLSHSLAEAEDAARASTEVHRQAMKQTKQRAAQMLARNEAALLAARQAVSGRVSVAEVAVQTVEEPGAGGGSGEGSAEAGADGGAGMPLHRDGAVAVSAEAIAALLDAAPKAAAVTTPQSALLGSARRGAPPNGGSNGHHLASPSNTPADLASRFARRIAELELALNGARESIRTLEDARKEDEKRRRALQLRVKRHEKGGGADIEYLRNVLLRWFMLPPEERGALFPVIAAACAFTPKEIGEINRAREGFAPSGVGAWLFGGGGGSGADARSSSSFADGPPSTPLMGPPARTPRGAVGGTPASALRGYTTPLQTNNPGLVTPQCSTAGGGVDDVAALQTKISKLRWLLKCANAEIQKLKAPKDGAIAKLV